MECLPTSAPKDGAASARRPAGWWAIGAFAVLLLLYSHYSAAPVSGLHLDDWGLLSLSTSYPSAGEMLRELGLHPHRPVGYPLTCLTYRLLGLTPLSYAILGMATYSAFILAAGGLVYTVSCSRRIALLFCAIFALLPNLPETYHWANVAMVGALQLFYVVSALAWVLFLKTRRAWWLLPCALAYAAGLGSYEVGIGIPLAFAMLTQPRRQPRQLLGLVPLLAVLAFYLGWRATNAFGLGKNLFYGPGHFELDISIWTLRHNAAAAASWWLGAKMMTTLRQGLDGFAFMAAGPRALLFVGNAVVVVAMGWMVLRSFKDNEGAPRDFSGTQVLLFGAAWAGTALFTTLLSYAAARQNFFPAIGIAMCLAYVLARLNPARWLGAFSLLAFLSLVVNQGTAATWRDAGVYQQRIFQYLKAHEPEWRDKQVILFDSESTRQRITQGLLTPINESVWPLYGNVCLMRTTVPWCMVRLIQEKSPRIEVCKYPFSKMDVEMKARIKGEELVWYESYESTNEQRTVLADVFIVDCFEIGTRP